MKPKLTILFKVGVASATLLAVTVSAGATGSLGHIKDVPLLFSMQSEEQTEKLVTASSEPKEVESDTATSSSLGVSTTVVPSSVPSDTTSTNLPATTVTTQPSTTTAQEEPVVTVPPPPETTLPTLPALPETTLPTLPTLPDQSFLDEANQERTDPLVWSGELAAYARVHLLRMMSAGYLYHSDLSRLLTHWNFVGENVGVGTSVEAIHTAYMNSPTHAQNVVDSDFTHFGSATENGPCPDNLLSTCLWTVEVFGV